MIENVLAQPGESYRAIAARTGGVVVKSAIENIVKGEGVPGKWPMTVPKLKALASALHVPWPVLRDAVNLDTGTTVVGEYEGARVVVATRAQEELTPDELAVWEDMAEDLIELVRRHRRGEGA